ncbi:MAG: phosphonate transporter [Janthinobacterium lividum]
MTFQREGGDESSMGPGGGFSDISLADLETLTPEQLDALPYGVVGLGSDGMTELYNATEAKLAGIMPTTVLGWHYFSETAQCMNNFMVAQRFEDEAEIDDIIDYVLTLRMRPTPVRLRLLKTASVPRRYLLIER